MSSFCQCNYQSNCGSSDRVTYCYKCKRWWCQGCIKKPDHHPCERDNNEEIDDLETIPVLDKEPNIILPKREKVNA